MISVHSLHITPPSITEITDAWIPHIVHIPLYCGTIDDVSLPEIGTIVREGDVLKPADASHPAVMTSVPGEIAGYREMPLYDGGRSFYAVIRTNGAFSYFARNRHKKTVQTLTALELSGILNKNGVYNTFDRAVPFAEQVRSFQRQIQIDETDNHDKSVRVLCVRLFDEDPVSITGKIIAERYFDTICEGVKTLANVIQASYVYMFYSADQKFFEAKGSFDDISANVQFIPVNTNKYPCGRERDLRIQLKKAGISHADDTLLFVDSPTMYATAMAAVYDQPILETLVQVNGSSLKKDHLFKVRIGTPIGELVSQCSGLKHQPQKLLINGMVRGFALAESQVPVTAQVISVTVPAVSDVADQREVHCIRCGNCHRACSVGIHPDKLLYAYMNGKTVSDRIKNIAALCNDCRLCNIACPARLPLSQTIQLLREGISYE